MIEPGDVEPSIIQLQQPDELIWVAIVRLSVAEPHA
jgi:hypothetical protein